MSDWKRLGDLLVRRRVDLGFPNRSEFARHLGLKHQRTLSDIENCKRDNYERATLVFVESAYRWKAGSIEAVLSGGDPMPEDDDRAGFPSRCPYRRGPFTCHR